MPGAGHERAAGTDTVIYPRRTNTLNAAAALIVTADPAAHDGQAQAAIPVKARPTARCTMTRSRSARPAATSRLASQGVG